MSIEEITDFVLGESCSSMSCWPTIDRNASLSHLNESCNLSSVTNCEWSHLVLHDDDTYRKEEERRKTSRPFVGKDADAEASNEHFTTWKQSMETRLFIYFQKLLPISRSSRIPFCLPHEFWENSTSFDAWVKRPNPFGLLLILYIYLYIFYEQRVPRKE